MWFIKLALNFWSKIVIMSDFKMTKFRTDLVMTLKPEIVLGVLELAEQGRHTFKGVVLERGSQNDHLG